MDSRNQNAKAGEPSGATLPELAERVQQILAELGDSAKAVAEALKASNTRGARNAARMLNPIVRHVRDALAISFYSMDLLVPGKIRVTMLDSTKIEADLPVAVVKFLAEFNRGKHPGLEMTASDE